MRLFREAEDLLLTHHITYPRPEAALLLQIRKGELPYAEGAAMLEHGLAGTEVRSDGVIASGKARCSGGRIGSFENMPG